MGVSKQLWPDHLEGDNPVHHLVFRLEDGPHAARPDAIAKFVAAEEKDATAVEQLSALPSRQQSALLQMPGDWFGRSSFVTFEEFAGLGEHFGRNEIALFDDLEERAHIRHRRPMHASPCLG